MLEFWSNTISLINKQWKITINILHILFFLLFLHLDLSAQDDLTGIVINATEPYCDNGSIDITVNGGYPPYSFEWTYDGSSGPKYYSSSEDIDELRNYRYCVTVTDDFCGTVSECWDVKCCLEVPTETIIPYCNPENLGSISLDLSGGYSYYVTWYNSNDAPIPATDIGINKLQADRYTAVFTNQECTFTKNYIVSNNELSNSTVLFKNPSSIVNKNNGIIQIEVKSKDPVSLSYFRSNSGYPQGNSRGTKAILIPDFIDQLKTNSLEFHETSDYILEKENELQSVLPNPNIVPVGGTFTHNFTLNQAIGANRKYCFSFLERLIDEAQINDQVVGEVILRKNVCDHNIQSDFIAATPCDPGSYGMLNPGLPTMTPNGTTVGLQNVAPSNDVCSFEVKISDVEDPSCIKHDSVLVASTNVPLAINANACLVSKVTMPAGLVHDVNIRNLVATITNAGAVTAYLNSPSGTRIKLFDNVCPLQPNINVNLDQTIVWTPAPSITTALCNPLGRGGTYSPEESFKAFYGEQAAGDWYLEIFTQGAVTGTLVSWSLQILYQLPYDQPNVVLNNIPGICTQQYSWIHPILEDNCCAGTVNVSYTFENLITGERSIENGVISNKSGTINFQGLRITKIFKVGKTTIEYTLVDQYGNTSKCSFMVTVNDNEVPQFAGCPDRVINLLPGECLGELINPPTAADNCSNVTITFCFENGSPADIYNLPIGSYILIAKGVDIYGNLQTCRFLVTVAEYIPSSSDLTCNDLINLSLDSSCTAKLNADMILEGGRYGCYNNYIIKVTDYNNVPHSLTFSYVDVGHCFKVTIIDPRSGNSCWGKVCVEDKQIPIIECVRDTILSCIADPDPVYLGRPRLLSCEVGGVTWNYHDEVITNNECDEFVTEIRRIWTVTDVQGNFDTCHQIIKFRKFDLATIIFPRNYDDLDLAHLECSDVRTNKDISGHLVAPPNANWECVDGYLLDSVLFKARVALGADPRYYIQDPFNFGARSPRQLGWNYLESGKYSGNPSPYNYYYNQHPQWNPNQACWPGDRHVMWHGTGFPIIEYSNHLGK
jgi:subtilisin-like proprotein convertase family protein